MLGRVLSSDPLTWKDIRTGDNILDIESDVVRRLYGEYERLNSEDDIDIFRSVFYEWRTPVAYHAEPSDVLWNKYQYLYHLFHFDVANLIMNQVLHI